MIKGRKSGKILKTLLLTTIFTFSIGVVAFASSYYTSSISISDNSTLNGADRSFNGNHYSMTVTMKSIDFGLSSTHPTFKIVHNNYTFGVKTSTDTLSTYSPTLQLGYTHGFEFPGSIGSGTRAFNTSTQGTTGFYADPVIMQSY